ncbi:MAG: cell division protein ZapA [Cryomorphaceae bacterium]|nr:cell division protein ZapA [Cryomorphaceae bacterium]
MADDHIRISLQILNRTYPITVKRVEEEAVRAAAKNINDQLTKMQRSYNIDHNQDLLSMVAIQLATKLENLQRLRNKEHETIVDYSNRFHLLLGKQTT